MSQPIPWLDQIKHTLAEVGLPHVDLLLDQTGWEHSALAALRQLAPAVPWYSLFTGTPEEHLLHQAPILMRLDLGHWRHEAWLEELIDACALQSRLLLLVSPLSFDALSLRLQALSQVHWGGQPGLLRFYDPRIFPELLAGIFNPEQCKPFQQAASYWSWLDRDGHPRWLAGDFATDPEHQSTPDDLVLTDAQYDRIGSLSDAHALLEDTRFDGLGKSREQRFAALYRLSCNASDANYFGALSDYVIQQLGAEKG
ncbi:DUF4123 domain-containing protein [Pseudomonas solani]|uniref:DUF4123 domain-containing protein n=1 Tax=Pseudomonas solani TaxID=2731552 RepID=UPI0035BE1E7A